MKNKALWWWLGAISVFAAGGFAAVISTRGAGDRTKLWSEVGKGLIGLVLVGVLGTLLKLLADAYQARRQLAERRDDFRHDKYRRVVEATNALRKAGTLVNANRSVPTWSNQMLALIDASNELRLIKHEIYLSSDGVSDPPFRDYTEIVWLLETMYRYTEFVTEDFAENKKRLSELQRRAEDDQISEEGRGELQAKIWEELKGLPSVADLLADLDEDEIEKHETLIEKNFGDGKRPTFSKEEPPSRAEYEAAERLVLQRIAVAALGTKRT
jgi:hypothetical protein